MDKALIQSVLDNGTPEDVQQLNQLLSDPFYTFEPRPDCKHENDEQTSFINSKFDGTTIVIKGNGSGGSYCASYKIAKNLRTMAPPVDLAEVFIVAELHEKASNLWATYLAQWIPEKYIQHIEWYSKANNYPQTVILQPHKNGNRWKLIFRGASAGMNAFTSFNKTQGFWISEPISLAIVNELQTRCRMSKTEGFKFWELTPDPYAPFPALEELVGDILAGDKSGYELFHMNSLKNTEIKDWTWLENTPEELKATRTIGAFASFEGMVFKMFDSKVDGRHVKRHKDLPPLDSMHSVCMPIDFGFEHPTAALICAYDDKSDTHYVYEEWIKSELLISQKVEQLKAMKQRLGWRSHWTVIADPEDLQQRSEFAALGLPTGLARKDFELSIELLYEHLGNGTKGQPRLVISDQCKTLIRQMRQYRWMQPSKNALNPKASPQKVVKVDDDAVDCLRYYFASRGGRALQPWQPINTKR